MERTARRIIVQEQMAQMQTISQTIRALTSQAISQVIRLLIKHPISMIAKILRSVSRFRVSLN